MLKPMNKKMSINFVYFNLYRGVHCAAVKYNQTTLLYPLQTLFVVGYTVFTLSVRASVQPSVRQSVTFYLIT